MIIDVPLDAVEAGHLTRDRLGLEADAFTALKSSIEAHGQRVPAEVTVLEPGSDPDAGAGGPGEGARYGLISGWRRLQALRALEAETGEARFGVLRVLIRPVESSAEAYTAMVEENELRAQLSYYERARIVAEAARQGVFADQPAALRGLFGTASRAKRSKIGSFIDIHEALGDVLRFPAEIPERLGLALVSRLRFGAASEMRRALAKAAPESAAAELALLQKLARKPDPKPIAKQDTKPGPQGDVSRAKHMRETLCDGVEMVLSGRDGARKLVLSGPGLDEDLLARLRAALGAGSAGAARP